MSTEQKNTPHAGDNILQERKKRIFSIKSLLLLIISIILVAFLLRKLELGKTLDVISKSDIRLLTAACFIYFASNFFKALRFRVLLHDIQIGLFKLYVITSLHNFFNIILPARTGELTLVYYLKKIGGTETSKGLHSLIVVRIFDFIVISIFFVCSISLYYGSKTSILLVLAGSLLFILSITILFNLKWFVILTSKIFISAAAKVKIQDKPIIIKITDKIDGIVDEFSSFKTGRHLPRLAFTSILTWSALYALFFVSINAFGIEVNLLQSIAGSTGGVLTNVLPINSFGSFGTLEAGWTGGFLLVGMNEQDAIISGFGYHIISFFASGFIAAFCYIIYKIKD